VFQFLVKQGVQFQDQRVNQWGRATNRAMEEIAPFYALVQKILSFREKGQDLVPLRQMAHRDRIRPVWGQTRSATSRIYARNPAVQNVRPPQDSSTIRAGTVVLYLAVSRFWTWNPKKSMAMPPYTDMRRKWVDK